MADRIQFRRDTAARWAQYNPILLEGEAGYVTDNPNQYKIGDGVHAWNDLPLRGFDGNIAQDFGYDEYSVVSQRALTEKLYGNGHTETITDITKHDGQYYSLKDKILKSNKYYFYSEVDVPVDAKELEMRFELSTSGGIGVEFRGSDGSVTGTFSNDIPTGTTSMIFSYLNEAGVEYQSSQPFDGITFYKSIYYKVHDINVQNYIGSPIRLECEGGNNTNVVRYYIMTSNNVELSTELEWSTAASWNITLPSNAYIIRVQAQNRSTTDYPTYLHTALYVEETTTSTDSSFSESSSSQQGGGTSGKGVNPGTQTDGNDFGAGDNQTVTNYRYVSGGGGGGWYGGGASHSDSSVNQINASGGGSGFVNTVNNASYRPIGYTGLQLDSGSTKDGSLSFPSPSGGSETGHEGHGYARITVLE